jgi:putative endonuclease
MAFNVYIIASRSRTLYTGVTSNLNRRLAQHSSGKGSKFAAKYKINRLVYAEYAPSAAVAIEREKQIKRWRRSKKIALIESINPTWTDLTNTAR